MRTSVQLTADAAPWSELVDFVVGAEALGVTRLPAAAEVTDRGSLPCHTRAI